MTVWSSYNETLVTCGEIVLDFDVIDSRDNEFETINKRKKGEAPCTLILLFSDLGQSIAMT